MNIFCGSPFLRSYQHRETERLKEAERCTFILLSGDLATQETGVTKVLQFKTRTLQVKLYD